MATKKAHPAEPLAIREPRGRLPPLAARRGGPRRARRLADQGGDRVCDRYVAAIVRKEPARRDLGVVNDTSATWSFVQHIGMQEIARFIFCVTSYIALLT